MIHFEVCGWPAPQGSKTRMPNGAMLDGGSKGARDRHKNWRSAVADTARDIAQHDDVAAPLDGPLYVRLSFRFPMPARRPKKVRDYGEAFKTSAPDLDKLIRATLDGLTAGGLIADDRYVAELYATKWEFTGWVGCNISIGPCEP